MNQPVFWGALTATALLGAGLRLAARRPLWTRHSSVIPGRELAAAAVAIAILGFHCAAMFFADWVAAVPFAEAPAASVRALDITSQVTYWVPALGLAIALHRVWTPVLGLLVVALMGVGYTMFVPHALSTHLTWLATATVTVVLIATALVAPARRQGRGAS